MLLSFHISFRLERAAVVWLIHEITSIFALDPSLEKTDPRDLKLFMIKHDPLKILVYW